MAIDPTGLKLRRVGRLGCVFAFALAVIGCSGSSVPPASDGSVEARDTNSSTDTSTAGDTEDGISCAGACAKVLGLCPDYGSVWGDACTTACHNKQVVKPELAKTETDCIRAAGDCSTATICASDLPSRVTTSP